MNKRKSWAKCTERITQLGAAGHELRRPLAAPLRDGIHELRARDGKVHPRILYFFHGKVAVLAHSLPNKEGKVPDRDIDLAVARKVKYAKDPKRHTHEE